MVTRSPFFSPAKSRKSAANSFTRLCSSLYVIATGASPSGSGTKISAALFLYCSRCRSTQLKQAFSFPPTNHFQNGGSFVSSTLFHFWYHVRKSAYSSKHFGKFFSPNRLRTPGSARFACFANLFDGLNNSSSFQLTAICDSA